MIRYQRTGKIEEWTMATTDLSSTSLVSSRILQLGLTESATHNLSAAILPLRMHRSALR
jgi:hypothetical protein